MAEAFITRSLTPHIREDLQKKMVFLGGPRQVGKTFISERLLSEQPGTYLNWDDDGDRARILNRQWPADGGLLVLDEVHKYPSWRNAVKGLFDKRKADLQILVTGSARLDYYRHSGDSLQGRYFYYRLHPLSIAELKLTTDEQLEYLLEYSGFPEPYLSQDLKDKRRWSHQYRSRLVREDLRELEQIQDLVQVEKLALRLPDLVGSPLSLNSLREDLHVSHASVTKWVTVLERLYYLFRIYPFGPPGIRAMKKAAKHYHFDWTLVEEPGARIENLVASHLLKWCHYQEDIEGRPLELRYFRDNAGHEVDFVILEKGQPVLFLECKNSSRQMNSSLLGLKYLKKRFPAARAIVVAPGQEADTLDEEGIERRDLLRFFSTLV
ncbi:ATP-binding protein [bacterium]|nr:ATP-binding protein [bacterium]